MNHIDVSPSKSTAPSATTAPSSYVSSHQANGPQQTQQQQQQQHHAQQQQQQLNKFRAGTGLSYADTSTLSYPGSSDMRSNANANASVSSKAQPQSSHILTISHPDTQRSSQTQQQQSSNVPSSHQQAQQQVQQQQQQSQHHIQQSPATQAQTQLSQQTYAPAMAQNFTNPYNPYMNSYMNMNLYSPVTAGMRADDMTTAAFLGVRNFLNFFLGRGWTLWLP